MYQFSGDFSAVADFLYSDKGYSIGDSYKVHMEYLSIPLMGQYHFNGKVSVLAGIESNLFLGAHAMADGYRNQGTGYDRLMTFAVGGGVAYQLNPHVNVMARYFHGVSNAANENRLWIPDFKIDSRVIQ